MPENRLKKWPLATIKRFLKIVEKLPAIWNQTHVDYRQQLVKTKCFQVLVKLMNIPDLDEITANKRLKCIREVIKKRLRNIQHLDAGQQAIELQKSFFPSAKYLVDMYKAMYYSDSQEGSTTTAISSVPQPTGTSKSNTHLNSDEGFKWDVEHSIKLLQLIVKHPCIWKVEIQNTKTDEDKAKAFQQICDQMNLPGYDMPKLYMRYEKIRTLVLKKYRLLDVGDAKERERTAQELQRGYYPAAGFLLQQYRQTVDQKPGNVKMELKETANQRSTITHSNCRACLSPSDGSFKLINQANDQSFGLKFDEIFQQTTNYTVTTDRPFYPASLCGVCEQELLQSYLFKMKCEQTEVFMKGLYTCKSQREADDLYSSCVTVEEVQNGPIPEAVERDPLEDVKSESDEVESFEDAHYIEYTDASIEEGLKNSMKENQFLEDIEYDDYKMESVEDMDLIIPEISTDYCPNIKIDETQSSVEEINEEFAEGQNFKSDETQANDEKINEEINEEQNLKNDETQSNAEEINEEIDENVLEQKVTEQLEALEGSSTFVEYRLLDKKTPCEFCGKFMSKHLLTGHIRRMHSTNPTKVQCDICAEFLKDILDLPSHKLAKHSTTQKIYKCRYCDHESFNINSRRYHERLQHEKGKTLPCPVCSKPFVTASQVKYHMLVHDDAKRFGCSECDKRFKRKCQLDSHFLGFHTSIRQKCKICQKEFRTKKHCEYHVQTVHGSKLSKKRKILEEAKTEAPTKDEVSHINLSKIEDIEIIKPKKKANNINTNSKKNEVKKEPCQFCGLLIKSNRHIRRNHSTNPTKVQCNICEEFVKDTQELRAHKLSKHSITQEVYQCHYCEYETFSKNSRRLHERLQHENGKKLTCPVCEKSFLSASSLEYHMLVHDDAKRFECSECDKRFKRKCQLDSHYLGYHTSIRQKCSQCQKEFRTKKQCEYHVHTVHGSRLAKMRKMHEEAKQKAELTGEDA